MRFKCRATRVRRHAWFASVELADGPPITANLVVIATGGARSIAADVGLFRLEVLRAERLLVGGVFASTGETGRRMRAELPIGGVRRLARCTLLQTPAECDGGTALIVEAPAETSPALLRRCFARAAERHGLFAPMRVEPEVFATSVTAARNRFLIGGNRAALVIAGDAAQTGHVFAGLTWFANLWLAMRLGELLGERRTRNAIAQGRPNSGALRSSLAAYENASRIGARVLGAAASRHHGTRTSGDWAMAGITSAARRSA